ARLLRVVALGGAGPEKRARGGAVLGLSEQLLVGALLEHLDGAEAPRRVLHLRLALLGHGGESVPDGPAAATSRRSERSDWSRPASVAMLGFDDSVPFEPLTG